MSESLRVWSWSADSDDSQRKVNMASEPNEADGRKVRCSKLCSRMLSNKSIVGRT